ncbi:MAG: hypothetical protein EOP35_21515, partial [Rubrivivax sp.]
MSLASNILLNRIAAAGLLALSCAAHAQGVAQAATTTAPPPGTMMGAYGQSLHQLQATAEKAAAKPATIGTTVAAPPAANDAV